MGEPATEIDAMDSAKDSRGDLGVCFKSSLFFYFLCRQVQKGD